MFCPKCGEENTEGNKYCQKCGAPLSIETPKPTGLCAKCGTQNAEGTKYCQSCGSMLDIPKTGGSTTSLEPNVAGLLCYLAGWITGLIFILIEKENKFIRFHAMQSIVTFGALTVVWIILQVLTSILWFFWILDVPVWILSVVLWIILMVKAYQGERFKLPFAGDFAERNS
ncbi:MAG: zinc ribbon domain-containing protein [Dehalococcoidia bacterium]|nr:zinc ribbon domain-containing protein [Dehalococcoidia bacterium]